MKLPLRPAIDKIKTFSRTFVERPRFAMVIAIVLTIAGGLGITKLPVSQYPRLTPPSIQVSSPCRSRTRSTAWTTCST